MRKKLLLAACGLVAAGCAHTQTDAPMPTEVININCGATEATSDASGVRWSATSGFFDGQAAPSTAAPANAPLVCQSEHYGMTGFWLPLENGQYAAELTFCENYSGVTEPGQRVFDVSVEGVPLRGVDPLAMAGGRGLPVTREVDVHIRDGKLDIRFAAIRQQPQINAIRVRPIELERPPTIPDSFDQARDIPHGEVRAISYPSRKLGYDRPANVYTPPGYDPAQTYPVLYLLHGGGENQDSWKRDGHMAAIMDGLIADGRAKPMLVVMPYGFIHPPNAPRQRRDAAEALAEMEHDLLEELIPFIEAHYPVSSEAKDRALAGLSMGAGQVMWIGPRHADTFAYLGAFAPGMLGKTYDVAAADFPDGKQLNDALRLLWVSCGDADRYWHGVMRTLQLLDAHGVQYRWQRHDGSHNWQVWREALYLFAPRLFAEGSPSR